MLYYLTKFMLIIIIVIITLWDTDVKEISPTGKLLGVLLEER